MPALRGLVLVAGSVGVEEGGEGQVVCVGGVSHAWERVKEEGEKGE